MMWLIVMVTHKGDLFLNNWLPYVNGFRKPNSDALGDLFHKVPENADIIIRIRGAFVFTDVYEDFPRLLASLNLANSSTRDWKGISI